MKQILIVDDDPAIREVLHTVLLCKDRRIRTTATAWEARELLASGKYDLALLDLYLPDGNGIDLLVDFRKKCSVGVIVMTAFGSWDTHIKAYQHGAYYFLDKPFKLMLVRSLVNQAFLECASRTPQ